MLYEREKAWSLMSPQPVIFLVKEHNEYLVYWDGFLMPYIVAFNIAMEKFQIYPSPKMKEKMFTKYRQLYYSGAFGIEIKYFDDFAASGLYGYVRQTIGSRAKNQLIKKNTITEVLTMFDLARLQDD